MGKRVSRTPENWVLLGSARPGGELESELNIDSGPGFWGREPVRIQVQNKMERPAPRREGHDQVILPYISFLLPDREHRPRSIC